MGTFLDAKCCEINAESGQRESPRCQDVLYTDEDK